MKCLFLDLASNKGSVACVGDQKTVAFCEADHRIGDHELVPLIQEILDEAGWTFGSLTHLACVIGPGGFTSLRVAVAAMNTLSDQLQIPVTGIHLSDLYAARASGDFVWLHSTKKNELFIRGFGKYSDQWSEPTHVMLDDLKLPNDVAWVGELISDHQAALTSVTASTCSPLRNILPAFLSTQQYGQKILEPWYGRGY